MDKHYDENCFMNCNICDWKEFCIPDECPGYDINIKETKCQAQPYGCLHCIKAKECDKR